jgi:hypothetical protein
VSAHVWFLANGAAATVLSLLALRSLGFTAYTYGLLLAVFGITSLIGASIAPWSKAEMSSPSKDASPADDQSRVDTT